MIGGKEVFGFEAPKIGNKSIQYGVAHGSVYEEPFNNKDDDPWLMVLKFFPLVYPSASFRVVQEHVSIHGIIWFILRRCNA